MKGLQRIFITAAIVFFLLFSAGICLAIFLPEVENTSSVLSPEEARELFVVEKVDTGVPLSGPEEMMQAALSEAGSWIAEDLVISEYSTGADGQRFYTLSLAGGGGFGWIAIDVYGNLLSLYDPTLTLEPPNFTDINLEKEQAEAVAVGLLERLGFEPGSLDIINSELRITTSREYVIEFKPCLNGIFVDEGDYCEIHLSPSDGQVTSIDTKRSPLRMRQAPAEPVIDEQAALESARARVLEYAGEDLDLRVTRDMGTGEDGIRLRYALSVPFAASRPMLCWKVSLEAENRDLMGGTVYDVLVDAMTGETNVNGIGHY